MSLPTTTGKVIVYGGRGALGSAIVSYFKNNNWWVGCIDLNKCEEADLNVVVPQLTWVDQEKAVLAELSKNLDGNILDAVICVAGGWAGGNAAHQDFIHNSDLMWRQSVWSSTISASIASKYLKPDGLLVLPGAKAAASATPEMIGYGMAKAAIHHLTKSLSQKKGGLPDNSTVLALLPITLDTPMNRKWMPKADTSAWTPLGFIAELIYKWSTKKERPNNGSLVTLLTKNNVTELQFD